MKRSHQEYLETGESTRETSNNNSQEQENPEAGLGESTPSDQRANQDPEQGGPTNAQNRGGSESPRYTSSQGNTSPVGSEEESEAYHNGMEAEVRHLRH